MDHSSIQLTFDTYGHLFPTVDETATMKAAQEAPGDVSEMRVNWHRGLFRVWVILSAIWIALVVAFAWQAVAEPYVGSFAFIEGRGETAWAYTSPEAAAARRAKSDGAMNEISVQGAPFIAYYTSETGDALVDRMKTLAPIMLGFYEAQQAANRPNTILGATTLAFLPPIGALILGAALLWAVSGFRGRSDAT